MKKIFVLILTLGLSLFLTACNDEPDEKEENNTQENSGVEVGADEKVANDEVVVNINDTDIVGEQYNSVYIQTKMRMYQFGEDISDKEAIKDLTIDELIAQELLIMEAENQGIEVSSEEVESEFKTFKSESGEQLNDYLNQFELTEDAFKDQIKVSLILNEYLDEKIKIDEVTDEEVKSTYDRLKEQNEDIPDLAELDEKIKEQLVQQKKQEKLRAKVEELKSKAKIEKKI